VSRASLAALIFCYQRSTPPIDCIFTSQIQSNVIILFRVSDTSRRSNELYSSHYVDVVRIILHLAAFEVVNSI